MRCKLIALSISVLAGSACNKSTMFPPGLDPLDEVNKAPLPMGTADNPYPEVLSMVSGHSNGYDWVHARAYVDAAPAVTYLGIHTAKVSADPTIDGPSFTYDVEPLYEYSYKIHYEPSPGVEFEVTWRHGVVDGTDDAPDLTASRFQKTWGTTYINLLQGSVLSHPVADAHDMPVADANGNPLPVTEIEIIEHLDATAADTGTLETYFRNFFKDLLTFVHSQPSAS